MTHAKQTSTKFAVDAPVERPADAGRSRFGGEAIPTATDTAGRLVHTINAGDETALSDLLAEDVSLQAPPGVRRRGVGASARYLMSWVTAFPGCRALIVKQLVAGDWIVHELRFQGTHSATLEGQGEDWAATGRPLDLEMVLLGRYEHGLALELRFYFDRLEMMSQLGLTPRRRVAEEAR